MKTEPLHGDVVWAQNPVLFRSALGPVDMILAYREVPPGSHGLPGSRLVNNLVLICVYMETGTSRLTGIPIEQSGANFVHINAISRFPGMKWNEIEDKSKYEKGWCTANTGSIV